MSDDAPALEDSLRRMELAAEACLKAGGALSASLKALIAATEVGDLKAITRTLIKTRQSLTDVSAGMRDLERAAPSEEIGLLSGNAFLTEVHAAASRAGLRLVSQGDRLYAPPHEIRVLPTERVVLFGRRRIEKLRPSALVAEIKRVQGIPPRFKPDEFLDALREAFDHASPKSTADDRRRVVPLVEIYELLTLLPGSAREYTLDDFARDVYLLDRSGVARTKRSKGATLSFVASSGTRLSKVLTVMSDEGLEQKYYAIGFVED